MILECEQCQTHVAEDDILSQEVRKYKQLKTKQKPKLLMVTQVLIHLIRVIMCLVTGWLSLSRKAIPLSCAYLLEGHRNPDYCHVSWLFWGSLHSERCHNPVYIHLPIQLQSCPRFSGANLLSVYPPWHTSYWDDRIFHHRNGNYVIFLRCTVVNNVKIVLNFSADHSVGALKFPELDKKASANLFSSGRQEGWTYKT